MIPRDNRTKLTGEIFTPLPLVDEILDQLPQELFTNPEKTFLDPAAGNGNFLVRVLERKIKVQGKKRITQALKTTFGVDIMKDNIEECKQRLATIVKECGGKMTKERWDILNYNIVWASSIPVTTPVDDSNWSNREWDFENWSYKDDISLWVTIDEPQI